MPTLALPDVDLSYVQQGTGPDIVWIPGGDQRGVDFAEQYEAFPDFRNTAYDPRGVGETVSAAAPPWDIVDYARDCARADPGGLRSAGVSHRAVDGIAHRAADGARLSGADSGRDSDGHRRQPRRVPFAVDEGRDRLSPGRRHARGRDGGAPLRDLHVPLRGAGKLRAVGTGSIGGRERLRVPRQRDADRAVGGMLHLRWLRPATGLQGADPRHRVRSGLSDPPAPRARGRRAVRRRALPPAGRARSRVVARAPAGAG